MYNPLNVLGALLIVLAIFSHKIKLIEPPNRFEIGEAEAPLPGTQRISYNHLRALLQTETNCGLPEVDLRRIIIEVKQRPVRLAPLPLPENAPLHILPDVQEGAQLRVEVDVVQLQVHVDISEVTVGGHVF